MLRRQIYQALSQQLRDSMPQLEYIDLQKGQLARAAENYPIPLPSALIEFRPVQWSSTGEGGQIGKAAISVHIYVDHVADTFEGSDQTSDSVKDLDIIDEVFEALQGFATESMGPLNRTSDTVAEFRQRFVSYRTDFETNIYQERTQAQRMATKPSVNITTASNE